jgi:hypothetical protein
MALQLPQQPNNPRVVLPQAPANPPALADVHRAVRLKRSVLESTGKCSLYSYTPPCPIVFLYLPYHPS